MRKDRFTDEALRNAQALAELEFSESYDFARCQRPNGSFYGIPEGKQCKKGTKAAPAAPEQKSARQAAGKQLKAVAARAGTVQDKLIAGRNPASASKKLARLEAKAARLKRVKKGLEDPSLRLRKALNKIRSELSRLEEAMMRPNSPNPDRYQDRIDRLEKKEERISAMLKRGKK